MPNGAFKRDYEETVKKLACDDGIGLTYLFFLTGPDSPSVEFKVLLENEKNNFRLVNTAVSFLGGVPAMINPADMSNTIPNEKVRPDMEVFSSSSAAIHLSVFQEVKLVMDFTASFFFSFFFFLFNLKKYVK